MDKLAKGREKYLEKLRSGEIIEAKCWDCCCFQRKEVTLCEITDCPLWKFRPWQR